MAKELTPIDYATDSPMTLITLANAIVDVIATEVVTANSDATGALTTGNAYVSGIFGASVIVGGEIRGGAVEASANAILSSNLVANGTGSAITVKVGNTTVNSTYINVQTLAVNSASIANFTMSSMTIGNTTISGVTYQANSVADQVFDYFAKATYRAAEYLISLADTQVGGNSYQVSKVLVVHDGSSAFITQYGIVFSNNNMATINVSSNATSILLTISPVAPLANVELQATRFLMST